VDRRRRCSGFRRGSVGFSYSFREFRSLSIGPNAEDCLCAAEAERCAAAWRRRWENNRRREDAPCPRARPQEESKIKNLALPPRMGGFRPMARRAQ
jgi:hypothetical protein